MTQPKSKRLAVQQYVDDAVAGEATRAGTAEGTKVNASTYTSGQATQDAALASEATRATAAETALQNLTNSSFVTGLNNAFARRWQPMTAYLANDLALAPDGTIIQRNADGTSRASYDATEQAAWTVTGGGGAVSSVAGKTGAVTLVRGDVGLPAVDNTADASKPVSTAQQAAIDAITTRHRGRWAATTAYRQGDRVLKNGRMWEARTAFTSGTAFQVGNWLPLGSVQRGTGVVCTSRNAAVGAPNTGLSDGTNTSQNTRTAITFRTPVGRAVVRFGNWVSTSSYDIGPGNDITVSASIELSTGRIIPITFGGGNLSVTIPTLGTVTSDPIAIGVPAGTTGWFRSYVRVASAGQKWPVYGVAVSGSDSYVLSTSGTDSTQTTGALASSANIGIYQPLDCVAIHSIADTPSVVVVGDSIAATPEKGSFLELALNSGGIPFVNLGRLGDSAQNWRTVTITSLAASEKSAQRRRLLDDATHVICEMGRNDISGGFTLLQMQQAIQEVWTMLRNHGALWIAQTTITPKTTSTDSWATVGNQTTDASDPVRQNFNAWLLSSAVATGLVDQIYDTAAIAQASSDATKWTAGYTTDGLHPNATAATAISAAIDTTKLTFV